jgi:hypothetical protein
MVEVCLWCGSAPLISLPLLQGCRKTPLSTFSAGCAGLSYLLSELPYETTRGRGPVKVTHRFFNRICQKKHVCCYLPHNLQWCLQTMPQNHVLHPLCLLDHTKQLRKQQVTSYHHLQLGHSGPSQGFISTHWRIFFSIHPDFQTTSP